MQLSKNVENSILSVAKNILKYWGHFVHDQGYRKALKSVGLRTRNYFGVFIYKPSSIKSTWNFLQSRQLENEIITKFSTNLEKVLNCVENNFFYKPKLTD